MWEEGKPIGFSLRRATDTIGIEYAFLRTLVATHAFYVCTRVAGTDSHMLAQQLCPTEIGQRKRQTPGVQLLKVQGQP